MDQQQIIIQAFGLNLLSYSKYQAGVRSASLMPSIPNINNYQGNIPVNINEPDKPDVQSVLGTPVWGSLKIKGGQYFDTNANVPVSYSDFQINTILMTLTQTSNVVLTKIQGKDGEIIEYIGRDSFRINFKGGFFSNGNARPIGDINAFKFIIQSNQPIKVDSSFLIDWDITEIVVLDKHMPQIAGGYNYQLFEFNAIQNTPIILAQQTNVT